MAKCPKCGNDSFSLEKVENPPSTAFVKCSECDTVVGALEDVDFNKWRADMYRNHGYFENEINILKADLKKLTDTIEKQNSYIVNLLEILNNKVK